MPVLTAILNNIGAGKQMLGAAANLVAFYVIGLPMAAAFCFSLGSVLFYVHFAFCFSLGSVLFYVHFAFCFSLGSVLFYIHSTLLHDIL